MKDCRHGMNSDWCGDCRQPVRNRKAATPLDLESILDVILDAGAREAILERVPGVGVPAVSPGARGGTSERSLYYQDRMTEAMLTNYGDGWSLEDIRRVFELKGALTDAQIGELIGRTEAAVTLRRGIVLKELGVAGSSADRISGTIAGTAEEAV